MRGRPLGVIVGIGAAFLALRPIGPLERAMDLVLLPARVVAPMGLLSVPFAGASASGVSEAERALEEDLSLRLERAVLRSAWPLESVLHDTVVPVPGEVDGRQGTKHDHMMVRVADASGIEVNHPVVAGDVYVGRVSRIPYRDPVLDRPSWWERGLRKLGVTSPPPRPPQNIVEVALITGGRERVGAVVVEDQDGVECQMVVGGLAPRTDRIWLAVHNPESRASRAGQVVVEEPFGHGESYDALAEGFVIGELTLESIPTEEGRPDREVLGVEPPLDFESGLNQVLVLTGKPRHRTGILEPAATGRARAAVDAKPVLLAERWLPVRLLAHGDTASWRSTARLNLGTRSGLRTGAAVVDGVRLVGRVARSGASGANVALLDDPGFSVDVLAQAVSDPDGEPLVLGRIRSLGRLGSVVRFEWQPEGNRLRQAWCERYAEEGGVDVRLWTGSGLSGTPRGLLVGRTRLPFDDAVEEPEGAAEESPEETSEDTSEENPAETAAASPEDATDAASDQGTEEPSEGAGQGSRDSAPVLLDLVGTGHAGGRLYVRIPGGRRRAESGPDAGTGTNPSTPGVPSEVGR